MALDVELKVLKPNHTHEGTRCMVGDIIAVNPNRAQRLIAQGIAEKVGVRSSSKAKAVEAEEAEAPETVDDVGED